MIGINKMRKSAGKEIKEGKTGILSKIAMINEARVSKYRTNELPSLASLKIKHPLVKGVKMDPQTMMKKGNSSKEPIIHYI